MACSGCRRRWPGIEMNAAVAPSLNIFRRASSAGLPSFFSSLTANPSGRRPSVFLPLSPSHPIPYPPLLPASPSRNPPAASVPATRRLPTASESRRLIEAHTFEHNQRPYLSAQPSYEWLFSLLLRDRPHASSTRRESQSKIFLSRRPSSEASPPAQSAIVYQPPPLLYSGSFPTV